MDLITQGVLGAAIGEAGWRHKLGRGAVLAGIFFGLMPDFDVISSLWGPWTSIVHHRGFTHSIFFAPLIAPIGGYICWRLSRKRGDVKSWIHLAFWSLLTHPLLDVFTVYGTQLLTPVSDERFSLDGVSIIDPLYTLPLIASLILAYIWRAHPRRGQRLTAAMLAATTLYLGLGYWTGQGARKAYASQLEEGRAKLQLDRVRATPTFANLIVWRVIATDDQGNTHVGLYSVTKRNEVAFVTKQKLDSPLIARAMEDERARLFTWFAQDWIGYRVEESPNSQTVHLYMDDLRYGGVRRPLQAMWGAQVTFDGPTHRVIDVERVNYRQEQDMKAEISALWRAITRGPDAVVIDADASKP